MTTTASAFLAAAAGAAALDWFAVGRGWRRVELVAKPLVLLLLIGVALTLDPRVPAQRPWVVAALVCGLVGDVALLREGRRTGDRWFFAGLGAFLLGHVAYVVSFLVHGVTWRNMAVGLLVVVAFAIGTLTPVLAGARTRYGSATSGAVAGYTLVLSLMVVTAFGTGEELTALGAMLFLASDLALGWQRFVRRLPGGDVLVMVTYHLAQGLIVVGLVR